jgi:hypothetical protein
MNLLSLVSLSIGASWLSEDGSLIGTVQKEIEKLFLR